MCGGPWERKGVADKGVAGVIGIGGDAGPATAASSHFEGCSHFLVRKDPLGRPPVDVGSFGIIWKFATNLSVTVCILRLTISSTACEKSVERTSLNSRPTRANAVEQ